MAYKWACTFGNLAETWPRGLWDPAAAVHAWLMASYLVLMAASVMASASGVSDEMAAVFAADTGAEALGVAPDRVHISGHDFRMVFTQRARALHPGPDPRPADHR